MDNKNKVYTVKQLARLAGVTPRALHYYDQIGLLRPASYGENGYRYYGEDALLHLQQILFYRELDFSLEQIKTILNQPEFDLVPALEGHKRALRARIDRMNRLIQTIDRTIQYLKGKTTMSVKDFYSGFDEAQQKEYEQEVRARWGDEVIAKTKDWNANSREQKNAILAELNEISSGVADNMEKGYASPEVQYWISRWHNAINTHFYECSLEVFEALGHSYVEDPRFTATYEKIKPGLAAFMEQAMTHYCRVRASEQA
ncbi:MAG TPA: MerR family transcriptional regulator [Anaerolineaceae bacterium]